MRERKACGVAPVLGTVAIGRWRRLGWRATLSVGLGLVAAGLIGAGPAPVTGAGKVSPGRSPAKLFGLGNFSELSAVAATSATNAWAVGSYDLGDSARTLVERWRGKAWKVMPSPNPSGLDGLNGVAATSATNAWAVGGDSNHNMDRALVERWNGRRWKVQKSPDPSSYAQLFGVAATSATNAWAVGSYGHRGTTRQSTLIEHWNGKAWKVQKSPSPTFYAQLFGVAAISAASAWAVGYDSAPHTFKTLIEHWNGKRWKAVRSPSPDLIDNELQGVAATSSTNVWAVGHTFDKTLVERWNGKTWKVVPSRNPASQNPEGSASNQLDSVAATSASRAWAVGAYTFNGYKRYSLVERWNGKAWKVVPSPSPSTVTELLGVAAASATSAWAVGEDYTSTGAVRALGEHWNGKAWKTTEAN